MLRYRIILMISCSYINRSKASRKHTLNEAYFDIIDSEDKAYFLGLLYADGYNQENKSTVKLTLQAQDKDILEKFCKYINSNKPLSFVERSKKNKKLKDCYTMWMYSKILCNQLHNLGCPQKKSFIITFPNNQTIPDYLVQHFIRGYFDGDGHFGVYLRKHKNCVNKSKQYVLSIVSTLKFCMSLQKIIKRKFKIYTKLRIRHKKRKNTTRVLLMSGRKQIFRFLDWIYLDAQVYLNRKHNKYVLEKL